MRKRESSNNSFEIKLFDDIEKYGCQVLHVFSNKESEASFTYSIGLFARFKKPEIVITGLGQKVSHSLINGICDEYRKGKTIAPFQFTREYLEGYDCFFAPVEKHHYEDYFGSNLWLYEGADFPVLQMIWPDRDGAFPWHPNWPKQILQPVLNSQTMFPN